jgi:hypothetical protein
MRAMLPCAKTICNWDNKAQEPELHFLPYLGWSEWEEIQRDFFTGMRQPGAIQFNGVGAYPPGSILRPIHATRRQPKHNVMYVKSPAAHAF